MIDNLVINVYDVLVFIYMNVKLLVSSKLSWPVYVCVATVTED